MKIYSLKRKTIPKIAVLATGLAAAALLVTISPQAAQAFPTKGSGCTGCHTAGGSVTATPSAASVAPSTAYTVALAFTGGSTPVGYAITGNGANVNASDAGPASMTAPAAVGSYTYTVWMRAGVVATTTYTITVGAVVTTPPPTTVPPTTVPPTTVPPTTVPPTTVPPTVPVVIRPISVGEGDLSPTSKVGANHLRMYTSYPLVVDGKPSCAMCHSKVAQPVVGTPVAPPPISGDSLNMGGNIACGVCHNGRNEFKIFVATMKPTTTLASAQTYGRCNSCHVIVGGSGDDGSDD